MPMVPLGLKETKEIDFREPFKVRKPFSCIVGAENVKINLFRWLLSNQ